MYNFLSFVIIIGTSSVLPAILFLKKRRFKKLPAFFVCLAEYFIYYFSRLLAGFILIFAFSEEKLSDNIWVPSHVIAFIFVCFMYKKLISFPEAEESIPKQRKYTFLLPLTIAVSAYAIFSSVILVRQIRTISSQEVAIEESKASYNTLEDRYNALRESNSSFEEGFNDVVAEYRQMKEYLGYVVFVGPDEYYYHSYDCPYLDMTEFWAYNTESAIDYGFSPCPSCQSN